MTPLDAAWHLLNALAAPFEVAALTVAVCGVLAWPGGIRDRLVSHLIVAYGMAAVVHLGAWWWWGAEGTMTGYAFMVVAVAATIWLRTGFRD